MRWLKADKSVVNRILSSLNVLLNNPRFLRRYRVGRMFWPRHILICGPIEFDFNSPGAIWKIQGIATEVEVCDDGLLTKLGLEPHEFRLEIRDTLGAPSIDTGPLEDQARAAKKSDDGDQ